MKNNADLGDIHDWTKTKINEILNIRTNLSLLSVINECDKDPARVWGWVGVS